MHQRVEEKGSLFFLPLAAVWLPSQDPWQVSSADEQWCLKKDKRQRKFGGQSPDKPPFGEKTGVLQGGSWESQTS